MKQSALLTATAVIASCFAAQAETFEWTGAAAQGGKAAWTNAANWKIVGSGAVPTRCPGALLAEHFGHDNIADSTLGTFWTDYPEEAEQMWADWDARQDTVIFAAGNGADVTIDMDNLLSISNVIFRGATSPTYTFGTINRWQNFGQRLPLGINGRLTVEQDVVNLPQFPYGVAVGIRSYGYNPFYVTFANETSETLVLNALGWPICWKYEKEPYLHYTFEGEGGFKVTGVNNNMRTHRKYVHLKQKGLFELSGTMSQYSYFVALDFDPPEGVTSELNLLADSVITFQPDGGNSAGIYAQGNARLYGEGTIKYNGRNTGGRVDTGTVLAAKAGCTLEIDTKLEHLGAGSKLTELCALGTQGSDIFSSANLAAWAGTVRFGANAANSSAVDFVFLTGGTVEYSDAAQLGEATSVRLAGNGTFAYTGAGETLDKPISVIAIAKTETLNQSTLPAKARIEQKGTGDWTIGDLGSTEAGAEVTLANDTEFSGVVAGEITGTLAVTKTGSGKWILSGDNTTVGKLTVSGGEIEVSEMGRTDGMTYDLAGGTTLRFDGDGVSRPMNQITARGGQSTVVFGTGSAAALNALPVSEAGGSVNFVPEGTATLKCPSAKGSFLPSYVMVDGKTALVDGDGNVVADDQPIVPTAEIPAKGGVIPDGEKIVGITTEGTDGPITLGASATAVDMLVQKTETTATVSIGADETLTTKAIIIEKDAGALTIEATTGGTLAAAEGATLTLKNDSTAALTVKAPLSLPSGAQVSKLGTGAVALPDSGIWSSDFYLTAGSLAIGGFSFATPGANESFTYAATGDARATLATRPGSTVHVSGGTAEGGLLSLDVPSGEMTVSGGRRIETMSVTVGGADDAKLVVKDGAYVHFPAKQGVFQIGPTSGTASSGVAEMVVENATVGALLNPGLSANDFRIFADRQDRAILVGGAKGDGLLRVHAGAAITNRLSMGASDHKSAVYMDGGTFVSLGGDCNYGGDRYTLFCAGNGGNQSYFEQTGGSFINYESAQMAMNDANGVYVMTGGTFWMGLHPLSASGSGTSYFTVQPSGGDVTMYVGGNAVWDGGFKYCMVDQGTGSGSITVDGTASMRFGQAMRFADNRGRDMAHPIVFNVNGNGTMQFYSTTLNANYLEAYDAAGNRIKAPAYLNLNGGTIVQPVDGSREFIGYNGNAKYQVFNRITVYEAGGTYQLTNGYMFVRGAITNATGKGVWSVPLDAPIVGSIVPPTVKIEGDGVAATALALFDSTTQTTTNILVTAHGVDYTWAKAKLYYGNVLIKEIDCELKDNATGPLTFRGATGAGHLMVYANLDVPEVVFEVAGGSYVNQDYAIPSTTVVTVNNGTFGFDDSGSTYRTDIPACLRSETGSGSLRANRPGNCWQTAGFPVRGSNGLSWNWATNLVVGCTTVDCAALVTNRLNGVIPTIADRYVGGLVFADTATIAFANLEALEGQEGSFTVIRYAPTMSPLVTDFVGMPKLATALPGGWALRKVGRDIRLKKLHGLAIIVR